jgi:hypothetical protein
VLWLSGGSLWSVSLMRRFMHVLSPGVLSRSISCGCIASNPLPTVGEQ